MDVNEGNRRLAPRGGSSLKSRVKRSFSRAALTYEEAGRVQSASAERLARRAAELAPRAESVLDIGCGIGDAGRRFAKRARIERIIGVDVAEGMAARAAATATPHIARYVVGDAEHLPLRGACADVALANFVFQWIEAPAQALAEIARVLRPGGLLAAGVLGAGTLAPLEEARRRALDESGRALFYSPEQFAELSASAGLAVIRIESHTDEVVYESADQMLRSLKAVGALVATRNGAGGLDGRRRLRRLAQCFAPDEPVTVSYVVHYVLARTP